DVSKHPYEGPIEKLIDSGTMVLGCRGKVSGATESSNFLSIGKGDHIEFPIHEKKSFGLSSQSVSLKPQESSDATFVLAWHFPNHPNGHEYNNRFSDAVEVANYVLANRDRLSGDTHLWHKTLYDSSLPHWLIDRLHSTVSTLATGTCQYWENGRFWAWEGVGCCEGTCTHVWNYAHAPARLFPQLERSARTMQDFGAGFHPDTGLVGFRSNDAYAADGQCGTVLKAYREHLMSEGPGFLEANWPKIKKALEYSIDQDENGDGLIENSQHNTFDINFFGPNTFVGSLYLAALRAGEEMAKEMGDLKFAKHCHEIFERGQAGSVDRLWNGEYFIQDVD
ncbi:MAG: hypothetical protein KC964_22725, partial [Candidatus Omnitrophica bacterium]|nr:hypothetical protein [Candidatus Omnitrophota bacterium]